MSATVEDALFAILDASSAVLALLGASPSRIYPNLAPEKSQTPYVEFRRLGGRAVTSMTGHSKLRGTSFDFDCWGIKPSEALAVAQAILSAFDGWGHYQEAVAAGNVMLNSVLFSGENQSYDDTLALHGMTYSFDVMYNEALAS